MADIFDSYYYSSIALKYLADELLDNSTVEAGVFLGNSIALKY